MPTMEVDGKKVSWEGRKMILQACQDAGVELPSYCYHPGLSIVASCRICLVEMEQPDPKDPGKLVRVPKLVPSCQTLAADGIKVYSTSPKSVANQKAVMEYLLINHPLDCPVCDQAGECYLQDYSYKYGRAESRFEEDKDKKPKKDIGKHVVLYSDRCIMCTRCVRFTREISGTGELAVFGRGHREQIDVFQGKSLDNPLSGNVIDICPVGALLDKDFLFTQRVWFLKSTPSISPFTSGGENIFVDHNEGRIYRIRPRFNQQVNKWWISDDIRYGFKFVHENRLATISVRGAQGEQRWSKTLEQIVRTFKEIVAAGGPGSTALVLSPFDGTEEMFLAAKWIREIDPQAWLMTNPPKVEGQDQVFKNPTTGVVNYTIRAEKAPNRKGAQKVISYFGGNTASIEDLGQKVQSGQVKAVVVAVDPIAHNESQLVAALGSVPTLIVLSAHNGELVQKASVALPVCTWAEKEGVFENFEGRIQVFQQAIAPLERSRPLGRVFWRLMDLHDTYSAAEARQLMAQAGLTDYAKIALPTHQAKVELMQFAEL
ncbi:MAG TPA: 2Fe-2S iron-sulfur cluster-binding protein [Phycisphaerae bacterium]|nr:2Fe-2S iron-sulfur cluster-binding protein [Phycisphaerae bacterium]